MKTRSTKTARGSLAVWHIPQVPGSQFRVPVKTMVEAKLLLDALASYDQFQFKHRVKPDYCNAGGLVVFDGKEWIDWYCASGQELDDYSLDYLREAEATGTLPPWEGA